MAGNMAYVGGGGRVRGMAGNMAYVGGGEGLGVWLEGLGYGWK